MAKRNESDEFYVIDLCDEILGVKASRQHKFDFLRGDGTPGRRLPVDAYYPTLNTVIEYRERQHTESVAFFNKETTVSGVSRDEQRRIYDQRRREVLPEHGIKLIEISYSDLKHNKQKRLLRERTYDLAILQNILENNNIVVHTTVSPTSKTKAIPKVKTVKKFSPMSDKPQKRSWLYRAYKWNGCLVMIATIMTTLILSVLACIYIFNLGQGATMLITGFTMVSVAFVIHYYTDGADEREMQKCNKKHRHRHQILENDEWPKLADGFICPNCSNYFILENEDGSYVCQDCGCIF